MNASEGEAGSTAESFIDRLRRESAPAAHGGGEGAEAPTRDGSGHDRADGPDKLRDPAGLVDVAESTAAADPAAGAEPARRMPPEARRALVSLMRQGVVLAARKARVFEALVRHEGAIRAHLAELYLQLVLDEPAGVAFLRNRPLGEDGGAEPGDGRVGELEDEPDEDADDGATLIARRTLSLYDTLLLLILRKHYQERQSSGEQRIVVDIERIESAFVPFLALTASERGERRQLNAALGRLVDKRLLARVRGDDERFEITPVIRYVVDAAFLETLLAEYERLAGGSGDGPGDAPPPDEEPRP